MNASKLIIESNVPYMQDIFTSHFDTVQFLPPEEITADAVQDADALIVRTRTRCNEALLQNSKCRFIGTATIGTDHIDLDYCRSKGIEVASAPGCNAPAVAQYVLSTVGNHMLDKMPGTKPQDITIGIIGHGHVGSIVDATARNIGFRTLVCDPPKARLCDGVGYVPLRDIVAASNIITIHTPLNREGIDSTYHLIDKDFIDAAANCRLLINAARGAVANNAALATANSGIDYAIDCWEGEPDINTELLARAYVATPHIAGYSMQGKMRGSLMIIMALAQHFNLDLDTDLLQRFAPVMTANGEIDMGTNLPANLETIMRSYNPLADTEALRTAPQQFEQLRNHYHLRPEPK